MNPTPNPPPTLGQVLRRLAPTLALAALFALAGCGEDATPSAQSVRLSGKSQKGPFLPGGTVVLQQLSSGLVPTGFVYYTDTTDHQGSFTAGGIASGPVEVSVTGFFHSELFNQTSSSTITLSALSDLSTSSSVRVNVLTHLAKRRIRALVGAGSSFSAAVAQAQAEVLAMFGITDDPGMNFDQMDLSVSGEANAMLLAASIVMLQAAYSANYGNPDAQLAQHIAQMALDLEADGVLDDPTLRSRLVAAGQNALRVFAVRQHLESYFASIGVSAAVPAFEDYIDSDGDGLLNRDDPDDDNDGIPDAADGRPYIYDEPVIFHPRANMPTARAYADAATVAGQIYAIGGTRDYSGAMNANERYDPATDTWVSRTPMPDYRKFHLLEAVGNKLYVIGGDRTAAAYGYTQTLATTSVLEYDTALNAWSNCGGTCTSLPAAITTNSINGFVTSAVVDGTIYLFGDTSGSLTTTLAFDAAANTGWEPRASMPRARRYATAAAVDGAIYLIGGWGGATLETVLTAVDVYHPATDTWSAAADAPLAVSGARSAVINGEIFVFYQNERTLVYTPGSNQWRTATTVPYNRHYSPYLVEAVGNRAYLIGSGSPNALGMAGLNGRVSMYDPAVAP